MYGLVYLVFVRERCFEFYGDASVSVYLFLSNIAILSFKFGGA